jgi:hypothetical protein
MDSGKGETPRRTTQDMRSADARNSPGNRKLTLSNFSIQAPRCGTRAMEKNPTISKTHPAKLTPKKVRQTSAERLKITNEQADHLAFSCPFEWKLA